MQVLEVGAHGASIIGEALGLCRLVFVLALRSLLVVCYSLLERIEAFLDFFAVALVLIVKGRQKPRFARIVGLGRFVLVLRQANQRAGVLGIGGEDAV